MRKYADIVFYFILTLQVQVFASNEFCGVTFPLVGNFAALNDDEYRKLKMSVNSSDDFVPRYNAPHLFFVNKNEPADFFVLKYSSVDLNTDDKRSEFAAKELSGISAAYAGLLQSIKNEEIAGPLNGLLIQYNLKSSTDHFTKFRYYFINSNCALVAISSKASETLQTELESILTNSVKNQQLKAPAVPVTKKYNIFELLLIMLIDTSVLVLVFYPFQKFLFNKKNPKYFGKFLISRRIAARLFDGKLSIILTTFCVGIFADVFLLEKALATNLVYILQVAFLTFMIAFLVSRFGQTPGRYMLNLKVVSLEKKQLLNLKMAAFRDFPYYIFLAICSLVVIKDPQIFVNPKLVTPSEMTSEMKIMTATFGLFFVFSLIELITMLYRQDKRNIRDIVSGADVIDAS